MATTVRAPDGRTWKVARRWTTRRLRVKRADWGDDTEAAFMTAEVASEWSPTAAVLLGLVALLTLVAPVFFVAIEVVLIILAVAGGVVSKVVFRRPWIVEASTSGRPPGRQVFRVVGWRRSGEVVRQVAELLAAGHQPPLPEVPRPFR